MKQDNKDRAEDVVARILARTGTALESTEGMDTSADAGAMEREERRALRRVSGLNHSEDAIESVEYQRLALERVVLVGIYTADAAKAEDSLRELAALAQTAGSLVLDGVLQRREKPDPGTYLGSGKARELRDLVHSVDADTVIVDGELPPSQRRGLEDVVKVKVVDRTALILDIFAQHAKSREGKAQVELAQLEYMLPRLRGWGKSLSRQAGGRAAAGEGIGSRGPGETKIEMDRRRIRHRMARLRKQIAGMKAARDTKRSGRTRTNTPAAVVVGYTNAGKSSLLNALVGSQIMVADELFATLDPTVRKAETPEGRSYTLTDTVGFVSNLPHQLVEAFRSTLEEVAQADLLLHVVDAAHPDPEAQIRAVRKVLADIEGAMDIPQLMVLNKADLASKERIAVLRSKHKNSVVVSARTEQGIAELKLAIERMLPHPDVPIDLVIPFSRGDLVGRAHEEAQIDQIDYTASGTRLRGMARADLAGLLQDAAVDE